MLQVRDDTTVGNEPPENLGTQSSVVKKLWDRDGACLVDAVDKQPRSIGIARGRAYEISEKTDIP